MIVLTCVDCIMGTFIFIINIIHLFVYCLFVYLKFVNRENVSFRQCHMRHRYYNYKYVLQVRTHFANCISYFLSFRHYFDRKTMDTFILVFIGVERLQGGYIISSVYYDHVIDLQ